MDNDLPLPPIQIISPLILDTPPLQYNISSSTPPSSLFLGPEPLSPPHDISPLWPPSSSTSSTVSSEEQHQLPWKLNMEQQLFSPFDNLGSTKVGPSLLEQQQERGRNQQHDYCGSLRQLEELELGQESLNNSLLALTSHFAQEASGAPCTLVLTVFTIFKPVTYLIRCHPNGIRVLTIKSVWAILFVGSVRTVVHSITNGLNTNKLNHFRQITSKPHAPSNDFFYLLVVNPFAEFNTFVAMLETEISAVSSSLPDCISAFFAGTVPEIFGTPH
eukprot:sb/3468075/